MGLDLAVVELPYFYNFGQLVADDEGVWHCDISDGLYLNNICSTINLPLNSFEINKLFLESGSGLPL